MQILDFKLYDNDFKWDYKLHFPIPTLDYILRRTGKDLLLDYDDTNEANGAVIQVVRTAKNYLFSKRFDMLAWEYEIAHNEKTLYDVLEYLIEVINFSLVYGGYEDLLNVVNGKDKSLILENAKANLLGFRKVLPIGVATREGY